MKRFALRQKKENKRKEPAKKAREPQSKPRPFQASVNHILHLHQTIGNQAVQRLIKSGTLQLKDNRPQPGDLYSREIDQLAKRVQRNLPDPLQMKLESETQQGEMRPLIQRKKTLEDSGMETLAQELAGGNSRSTVAVAKVSNSYKVYAQSKPKDIKTKLKNYTNVSDGGHITKKGYHAEMIAIDNAGKGLSGIAASQPISERCELALKDYGVARSGSCGNNYTKDWIAPTCEEDIDVKNSYPGQAANDRELDGKSGRRYLRTGGMYESISKKEWSKHHETW